MQVWWRLATRNWRTRPGRSALAVSAVTLGVAVVVWVTCCYESVRRSVNRVVLEWIGAAHLIIEPVEGVWAVFPQDLEQEIARLPGVAQTTIRTREYVDATAARNGAQPPPAVYSHEPARVEVTGIVPEKEPIFRSYRLLAGRFITPEDRGAIVVEKLLADEFKLQLGDAIRLSAPESPDDTTPFNIIGVVDRRRASVNQAPMTWARLDEVQKLVALPGMIKGIDVMLHDADVRGIQSTAEAVRELIAQRARRSERAAHETTALNVKTTETQHKKLGAAQELLRFVMLLLSCVVLLTSFFIILASMSMGVTERIIELGLLRCIGTTRRQLAGLVVIQTLPLGVVGTLLGLPLGLALQWATIRAAPDYLGDFVVNPSGVLLAAVGGVVTSLLGAALPAVSAAAVSPVDATRAHAGGRFVPGAWLSGACGAILIAAHLLSRDWAFAAEEHASGLRAILSVVALYTGAALLTPAAVMVLGRIAARAAAWILRLRPQLLGDEVDKAPYRSAAICCGLGVGLSLIVGLMVWAQSVKAGWQFPSEFPDAMLYSYDPLPLEDVRALRDTPGITNFTVCDDFGFSLTRPTRIALFRSLSMLEQSSRFLAIEPEEGLSIIRLAYLEGNQQDAIEKLKSGGHILVTREFAQARDKHLGDEVTIWVGRKEAAFRIAGVIGSAGVDIAVSFFNATEFFQFYAVGAIFGTLDDAERLFGRRYGKMMLFDFDLPEQDRSRIISGSAETIVPLPKPAAPGERQTFAMGPGPIPEAGPQEAVVNSMLKRLGYPTKAFVTARELKTQIDDNINRVTLLLSAIPAVGLIIAAVGVANLMAANVASRRRQIAVLRAIGVTRRQMARMIIGEAVVLGLIGSAVGVALGMLLARCSNLLTAALSGYEPVLSIRWELVAAGAILATLLCVVAAIVPAARAGRTSIVSVLSSA